MAEVNLRTSGGTELRDLGRDLQRAGSVVIKRSLIKGLTAATRPAKDEIAASASTVLPNSGGKGGGVGLGDYIAELGVVSKVNTTGRNVGVRITGTKSKSRTAAHRQRISRRNAKAKAATRIRKTRSTAFGVGLVDLNAINRGRVKAPTFGHGPWKVQIVTAGFFDKPLKGPVSDRAAQACRDVIDEINREIGGR